MEILQITQQHIDRAVESISQDPRPILTRSCPVAQALRQKFPGKMISVTYTDAFVNNRQLRFRGAERYTRLDRSEWCNATPGEIEILN